MRKCYFLQETLCCLDFNTNKTIYRSKILSLNIITKAPQTILSPNLKTPTFRYNTLKELSTMDIKHNCIRSYGMWRDFIPPRLPIGASPSHFALPTVPQNAHPIHISDFFNTALS